MSPSVLNLSLAAQFVLASGYVAYRVGFIGTREHHRPVDVVFLSLAFSLIASGVLYLIDWLYPLPLLISVFIAFLVTVIVGGIWRKWGVFCFLFVMRGLKITWSTDRPSALSSIFADTSHPVSQITVELDDGMILHCDNTRKFRDAPFGPLIIGIDESILMYATHLTEPGKAGKILDNVLNENWGSRITYIPGRRIKQMDLRYL